MTRRPTDIHVVIQQVFEALQPEQYADALEMLADAVVDSDWRLATVEVAVKDASTLCCGECRSKLQTHADEIRSGETDPFFVTLST